MKQTYELVIDVMKNQFAFQIQLKRLPIAFRYMKNVGHYFIIPRRDMMTERASFGHVCAKKEIFIAGGQDSKNSELAKVESFDIKRDTWKNLPALNKARTWPSLCLFRQRFLYVFGGQNHSMTVSIEAKCISTIEKLDITEGLSWEVIKIKNSEAKIRGHSLGALQISASEILVFGSYYSLRSPTYDRILYYTFDHEKLTIKNCFQNDDEEMI